MDSRRKFIRNSVLSAGMIALDLKSKAQIENDTVNPDTVYPPMLLKGDLVALMAPAGAIFSQDAITNLSMLSNQWDFV